MIRRKIGLRSAFDVLLIAFALVLMGVRARKLIQRPRDEATSIKPGDRLLPITFGIRDSARDQTIQFPEASRTPTLIMVYTSTCPICEEVAPTWRKLIASATEAGASSAAITPDSGRLAADWTTRHGLRVSPLLQVGSPQILINRWNVDGVPTTIVALGEKVLVAHKGTLSSKDFAEVTSALNANTSRANQ